ncbi:MAG: class I SAM-dependent methyltransferase, partial [Aridibacter famidurans]|nr:class I SAM-dependent methyltransferase [Aridibacter famidurans]
LTKPLIDKVKSVPEMENAAVKGSICRRRTTCRGCLGSALTKFLSLGPTPLANSFLRNRSEFEIEESYPLDVYFCEDCSLVQLTDVISPEVLFRDYIYVTGTSGTIREHNEEYSGSVVKGLELGSEDLVIEIASNNGALLSCFKDRGVRVLGVEPAVNIAEIAVQKGIPTVNRFFDSSAADDIVSEHGTAAAVIGNNVLAHVDETIDFLQGCKKLLAPRGRVVIEVPYLEDFVENVEFDTVYHEHLCYFSISSLLRLYRSAGLSILQVDKRGIHGGSLRVYAGSDKEFPSHADEVLKAAEAEKAKGLGDLKTYEDFAGRVADNKVRLVRMLRDLRAAGRTVAAYGAPAKGNTLLYHLGIGTDLLDFTVDKNPLKVGTYTPGSHLPVLPVSAVVERQPDYLLILAWNFGEEIMKEQAEYRDNGGRFIIPIPEATIIE